MGKTESMNNLRRLALYVFYDENGYVGDYVKYYIRALTEVTDKIIFIVNGIILPGAKKEIENIGAEIFNRENKGLDFGAWKDAILNLGFPQISDYDELILCNCSCYGPVYPLHEVFSEMESRKCDFWGITKHPATGNLIIKTDPSSAIIEHIQSYFLVFSRQVILSNAFQKWWSELESTSNYSEEVAYHENKFTQYLYNNNFSYDTYVNCDRYFKHNCPYTPSFACAHEMLKIDRDPFIKKKLFLNNTRFWSITGEGFTPVDTITSLKGSSYKIQYIFQDLLRNHKISEIKDAIDLTWVHKNATCYSKRRLALVCYVSCSDLVEYMSSYLTNMPDSSDLFLISSKQEVLDAYKKHFELSGISKENTFNKITYLIQPDRYSDIASLVITFAPYSKNYDGFCFIHDDCDSKTNTYTYIQDVLKRGLRCCLYSKLYVKNLIEALFDDSSCCGVMLPPTPYFSKNVTLGAEVVPSAQKTIKALLNRLHLKIKFDEKLVAPFENMFWARTGALKDLFECEWHDDDFSSEQMPAERTISFAIQRVICFCAQNQGYFSKWAMPENFAELYINNLSYRLRDYNIELNRIFGRNNWVVQLNKLKAWPSAGHFSLSKTSSEPVNNSSAGVKVIAPKTSNVDNDSFGASVTGTSASNVSAETVFSIFSYLRYKLLYKVTFGHRKEHYRIKYMAMKAIKDKLKIQFF